MNSSNTLPTQQAVDDVILGENFDKMDELWDAVPPVIKQDFKHKNAHSSTKSTTSMSTKLTKFRTPICKNISKATNLGADIPKKAEGFANGGGIFSTSHLEKNRKMNMTTLSSIDKTKHGMNLNARLFNTKVTSLPTTPSKFKNPRNN